MIPTKQNLLQMQQKLILARKGHDLLDKKFRALTQELSRRKKSITVLEEKFETLLIVANRALSLAAAEIGYERVDELLQQFSGNTESTPLPYNLGCTCTAFDEAFLAWQEVQSLRHEIDALIQRINQIEVQKRRVGKRVMALEHVTIPIYESHIKRIREVLEERERDEFSRLKIAKEHLD